MINNGIIFYVIYSKLSVSKYRKHNVPLTQFKGKSKLATGLLIKPLSQQEVMSKAGQGVPPVAEGVILTWGSSRSYSEVIPSNLIKCFEVNQFMKIV